MSALNFEALLTTRNFENGMQRIRNDIRGTSNLAVQEAARMDSAFKNLSIGMASYFSAQSLTGFVKELINVRGEFQKTEIAFSTMLGNAEQAKSLMNDMVNLAAKTPFSLQDVSNGAKQLLAFQVPADQVVDTLTRMGNIAAGLGVPLSRINLVYGQVKAKGRLMGDDLRQFTEAGIPMVAELAKKFSKTEAEIIAMVSAGKIGFKDVEAVLKSLTNEGGMFFNLMEKQSASLSGKVSNLEDAWDQMLNKIGESQEGLIAKGIDGLAYLVEHYEEVLRVISTLVAAYGTYRAVLITVAVTQRALAIATFIKEYLAMARALGIATANMIAFNTATLANPYTLAAAGIAAIVAALVYFNTGSSEAKNNAELMAQAVNSATASIGKESLELRKLYNAATDEKKSRKERTEAVKELQRLYPSYFRNLSQEIIMTGKAKANYDELRDAIIASARARAIGAELERREGERLAEEAKLQEKLDEATKRRQENLRKGYKDQYVSIGGGSSTGGAAAGQTYKSTAAQQYKNDLRAQSEAQDNLNSFRDKALKEDEFYIKKKIELDEKASKYNKDKESNGDAPAVGTKKGTQRWYEEEVQRLKEANQDLVPQSKEWLKNMALIQRYNDVINYKNNKDNRQIAEILPVGSIAELQRRAKLIEDAANVAVNGIVKLRKVDKYGAEKDKKGNVYYTGETVTVEEAKKRVEAINRAIREKQAESQARTFSEEMDEIKRQIGIRDKLLQQGYTKESVDKMFPKIKDKSFLQYLEETDIAVKKLIESGEADKETIQNLDLIKNSLKEYKGLETYIEGVNNQIDVLKTKFSGSELISQLDKFKKLNAGDSTEDERASRDKAVKKAQDDERKRVEANYNQLLNDHKTFEEKKAKITRDLNDALGLAKNDSEKEKIRKAYNEQFSAITVEAFRNSKDWQIAFSELEFVTRSSLERILQQLIAFRQANKENLSVQDYKIVSDKITEIQNRLNISNPLTSLIQGYRDYRKASEDLKKKQEELNQANLDLAESYQLLNKAQSGEEFNVADQKRVDALKRRKKATEEVQQAEIILSEKQIKLLDSLNYVSKYFNDVRSVISSVKGIFDDLGISMDNAFGDILANLEQTMQGFEQFQQGLTNAFKGFASGNIIQGIAGSIQAIGGLIKSISGWFNNDKKKERQIQSWAREVENLKNVYAELEYTVKKALGENVYKGQLDEIKNLERQKALLSQMAQKEGDKKKKDQGKIDEYNAKMAEIDRTISDIRDNIIKTVLQTDAKDVASQLGDALVEAFSKGEDAAKSLDKAAGDVFRNMVKNALKMRMEKALQPVLDQILKASGFDEKGNGSFKGFTPEQIEQYKKQIAQIGASQEEFLKAYQQLFQDANSNVSGMEGSIKSITSEEAGALIAQINAMRINQGKTINIHQENLELMRGVLMQLMKIEDNTRNLHQMRKDLSELNSKVSKDNGLRPAGL
ncbi:hypothetical protein CMT69_01440 [Elizabethkingia anophelis]|nr:hypothetical protein [Elizabethkingia anophelis]